MTSLLAQAFDDLPMNGNSVIDYTEQHALIPKSGPESALPPQEFWAVLILLLASFLLLAWRAIDEMADGSSGDDDVNINNFPPF